MRSQNPFDKFASDFFRSKVFKTMVILGLLSCLIVIGVAGLAYTGKISLGSIPFVSPSETSTPVATSEPWRWVTLQTYNIHVEIPNDWLMWEVATNTIGNAGYGPNHDYCSDILFSSADDNEKFLMSAVCTPADTSFNPCPIYDFVNYGKGIVRVPMEGKNAFAYTMFDLTTGQCLNPPWWSVGNNQVGWVTFIIGYWEFDKPMEEIWDFTIPDRIAQSIYKTK
jgi:hypothetical protein